MHTHGSSKWSKVMLVWLVRTCSRTSASYAKPNKHLTRARNSAMPSMPGLTGILYTWGYRTAGRAAARQVWVLRSCNVKGTAHVPTLQRTA